MKLKPYLFKSAAAKFIVFLLLPASWFTGLVNEDGTVEDNRTPSDSIKMKRHTHSEDKLYESNKYYPIYGSSELGKDYPLSCNCIK